MIFGNTTNSQDLDTPTNIVPTPVERLRQRKEWRLYFKIVIVIFLLQFIGLCIWSYHIYSRFALTYDFATYYQAIFQIWHGNFYPRSSTLGFPFWGNGGQSLIWILALITYPFKSGYSLLVLQDLAVVITEVVAVLWIYDIVSAKKRGSDAWRLTILIAAIIMFLINPWTYWALSFDIHTEPFCLMFFILASKSAFDNRWRRMYFWSLLTMTGGLVEVTYVISLAILLMFLNPSFRKRGFSLLSVCIFMFLGLNYWFHANDLMPAGAVYGYLANDGSKSYGVGFIGIFFIMATHPQNVLKEFWVEKWNILANLAPGGVLGIFTRYAFLIDATVLGANILSRAFAIVSFQGLPIFIFTTIGTIYFINKWYISGSRSRNVTAKIALLMVIIYALGWTVVWLPRTNYQWVSVSAVTANTLNEALNSIPQKDQVVASQGISGRFGNRRHLYTIIGDFQIVIRSENVWFVITPREGISLTSPAYSYQLVNYLMNNLGGELKFHSSDAWVIEVHHMHSGQILKVPSNYETLNYPAVLTSGVAGYPVVSGNYNSWYVQSDTSSGYVVAYGYLDYPNVGFNLSVTLSTTSNCYVEVWDPETSQLLLRREIPPTNGIETLYFTGNNYGASSQSAFAGNSVFRVLPIEPSAASKIEIRVWKPEGGDVKVYGYQVISPNATTTR